MPVLKVRKVCRALERAGFVFARQSGSHVFYVKNEVGKEKLVVTVFPNYDEIDRFLLKSILKQSRLSLEEFLKLLR